MFFSFILYLIKFIPGESKDVLIQRCLDGDKKAEHSLSVKYLSRIAMAVSHKLKGKPKEDIEDIVQGVLMEAFSTLGQLRENSEFSAWIHQIAYNHCVDYLQQQSRQPERIPLASEHLGEGIELPSEIPLPDELIKREELSQQVREAIKELPLKYREAIVLRELEGLSYQDIAETLELEVFTVKSRLYEARKQLPNELRRIYPDEF